MKRVILGLVFALASAQSASADVYVKVDAQGNAIGGAIMCDAATCGAGSLYSQLTPWRRRTLCVARCGCASRYWQQQPRRRS
jgi:hypothetical protein